LSTPKLGVPAAEKWGVQVANLGLVTDFLLLTTFYRAWRKDRMSAAPEMQPMPRYVVEREFPDGLQIPVDETGAKSCLAVVENNLVDQVTWIHSYVSTDKKKTFCVYDAPAPEAIRLTATRCKLPVQRITEVRILDPYFFK
jgi:hypothetical protein